MGADVEKVYTFGMGNSLVGVVTEPEASQQKQGLPTVIILNSGLIHHVGPHRLAVEMARDIADQGYTVLRFDLSAIGDSQTRKANPSYQERAVGEIKEAMDFLGKQKGSEKFILIGLCTGADNAHRAAVADERVTGCVFMGGYAYPTRHTYFLKLMEKVKKVSGKLFIAGKWKNFIKKWLRKLKPRKQVISGPEADDSYFWKLPDKNVAIKDYAELISRKVHMLFLFTASELWMINYPGQIRDSFPTLDFEDLLDVELYRLSDHTYTFLSQRELLTARIRQWLENSYGQQRLEHDVR